MRASQARDVANSSFNESDLEQTFETIKLAAENGMFSIQLCGPYKDVEIKALERLGYKADRIKFTKDIRVTW